MITNRTKSLHGLITLRDFIDGDALNKLR